jgi:phosphoribosylpyrophosphate synthetase
MAVGPFAAKLQRLAIAPLVAAAIGRLHAGGSLSGLFE